MFYQIQFNDVQQSIARRIASMQADLIKYAANEKATPAAVAAKTDLVNQLNDYLEYINSLYQELRQEAAANFSAGYSEGYNKCKQRYEPHLQRRSNSKELDRFNSLQRARETWPELY